MCKMVTDIVKYKLLQQQSPTTVFARFSVQICFKYALKICKNFAKLFENLLKIFKNLSAALSNLETLFTSSSHMRLGSPCHLPMQLFKAIAII